MSNTFKLRNGRILLSTEAPGGIYNSSQLKKIASLCDGDSVTVKATEDQRLALIVHPEKAANVAAELQSMGLGVRHYQDGLHQPVSCIGELCEYHEQDALGSALDISNELEGITLNNPLKIGINGCARCCVPCHTLDISVVGDNHGYRISLGGKNSQLPEMAGFMAEAIPPAELPRVLRSVVDIYQNNASEGETLQEMIDRQGAQLFVDALKPWSQDASVTNDPYQDAQAPSLTESPLESPIDDQQPEQDQINARVEDDLAIETQKLDENTLNQSIDRDSDHDPHGHDAEPSILHDEPPTDYADLNAHMTSPTELETEIRVSPISAGIDVDLVVNHNVDHAMQDVQISSDHEDLTQHSQNGADERPTDISSEQHVQLDTRVEEHSDLNVSTDSPFPATTIMKDGPSPNADDVLTVTENSRDGISNKATEGAETTTQDEHHEMLAEDKLDTPHTSIEENLTTNAAEVPAGDHVARLPSIENREIDEDGVKEEDEDSRLVSFDHKSNDLNAAHGLTDASLNPSGNATEVDDFTTPSNSAGDMGSNDTNELSQPNALDLNVEGGSEDAFTPTEQDEEEIEAQLLASIAAEKNFSEPDIMDEERMNSSEILDRSELSFSHETENMIKPDHHLKIEQWRSDDVTPESQSSPPSPTASIQRIKPTAQSGRVSLSSFDMDENGNPVIVWSNGIVLTITNDMEHSGPLKLFGHTLEISSTQEGTRVQIDGISMLLPKVA